MFKVHEKQLVVKTTADFLAEEDVALSNTRVSKVVQNQVITK